MQAAAATMMTPLMTQNMVNPTLTNPALTAAMHATTAMQNSARGLPTTSSQQILSQRKAAARIYVGSLHYDLTETDIRGVFEAFGTITDVTMSHEPSVANVCYH